MQKTIGFKVFPVQYSADDGIWYDYLGFYLFAFRVFSCCIELYLFLIFYICIRRGRGSTNKEGEEKDLESILY